MTPINEQFATATRQLADNAARINRLALDHAQETLALQLATLGQNLDATFAFWGELGQARDAAAVQALWPRGLQVARENVERTVGTNQQVVEASLKTGDAIGQLATADATRQYADAKPKAPKAK